MHLVPKEVRFRPYCCILEWMIGSQVVVGGFNYVKRNWVGIGGAGKRARGGERREERGDLANSILCRVV